jgi:hypothetical protein
MPDNSAMAAAAEVARHLPGYRASSEEYGAYLTAGDARLHLTAVWNWPGYVSVAGCYPATSLYRLHRAHINVRLDRGAAVIAREITRRLLPGYTGQLGKVLDHNAREQHDAGTRHAIAGKVAAMFPGSHTRDAGCQGRETEVIMHARCGGSGAVGGYGDCSKMSMEIRSVPAEVMLRMLQVLAGA